MPSGRQQRAEELLRALLSLYLDKSSPHVLGSGADIRSVFLVDPGVAVIDLNSAFADTHRSGVLVEELTVASLIHTISANTPGILKVKILVDGKERDTLAGHADLSDFYDVTAVNQLATQLQPHSRVATCFVCSLYLESPVDAPAARALEAGSARQAGENSGGVSRYRQYGME